MREDSIAVTPRAGAVVRDGVVAVNEARRSAAEALDELSPPDEVAPEHRALEGALAELVTATDLLLAETEGLDAEAFEEHVRGAQHLQSIAERVGLACNNLEARLADLGVEAAIRC